jgi:hypothetical protein
MNKDTQEYIFKGFIAVILTLALYILSGFEKSINNLQTSVNTLNISLASYGGKLINQKDGIIRLEKRTERIEKKIFK